MATHFLEQRNSNTLFERNGRSPSLKRNGKPRFSERNGGSQFIERNGGSPSLKRNGGSQFIERNGDSPFLKHNHKIPNNLPIFQQTQTFAQHLSNPPTQIIAIKAPTGSGKTVGISIELAELGYQSMISIPTKASVSAMHQYIKTNAYNPYNVGCAYGGDIFYSDETLLKFVTTKHACNVVRQILSNHNKMTKNKNHRQPINGKKHQQLTKFDDNFVLVIDEAHQTSTENMVLYKLACRALKLGLLKKLVVMSATLREMNFNDFVVGHIVAEGRSFEIDIEYDHCDITIENQERMISQVIDKFDRINDGTKNILIFVSGISEAEAIESILRDRNICNLDIHVLSSQTESNDVDEAIKMGSEGRVKVVIATNIAESAITIPDIDYVIDTCLQKTPYAMSNGSGINLITEFAPRDKLTQRKGRCGRVKKGKYFPMITEDTWNRLKAHDLSDMERLIPYTYVIELLADDLDAQSILEIDPMKYEIIISKLINLELIEHTSCGFIVTEMGRSISKFPYCIENAVIAYKLAQLAKDPINNTLVLITAISMACCEGSGGQSFFFVPKAERANKKEYIEMNFSHLKGESDLETYIKIFFDMFDYVDTEGAGKIEKRFTDYARVQSMNNKLLKNSRKCFVKLINLLYGTNYTMQTFITCINDFGTTRYDEVNLDAMYEIFASANKDKIFYIASCERGGKFVNECDITCTNYTIDKCRNFCEHNFLRNEKVKVVALNITQTTVGHKRFNNISCIFPIVIKNDESTLPI